MACRRRAASLIVRSTTEALPNVSEERNIDDVRSSTNSRQLSTTPTVLPFTGLNGPVSLKWGGRGSNPRPTDYESLASVLATSGNG
jgi:hypothetical protein